MAEVVQDTARPRFYVEPVLNPEKSAVEGRPIYEDQEFVEIKHPGDKNYSFVEKIDDKKNPLAMHLPSTREKYEARWPREYAAFKKGEARAAIGTPMEQWPQMPRSRVAELKHHDILTVEELSNVQDNILPKLGMGARAEREQARAYLAAAKDNAANARLAAENAQLKERLDRLEQMMSGKPAPAAEPAQPQEKRLEDCSDSELKEFIKRETGNPVLGNPKRETLLARAAEVAKLIEDRAA